MTCLYQCDGELILEMSVGALAVVQRLVEAELELGPLETGTGLGPDIERELTSFANAIRSELQHRQPPATNDDLI